MSASRFKRMLRKLFNRKSGGELVKDLGVKFGEGCRFVSVNRNSFGSEPYLVTLGNRVEIAAGVRFLTHDGSIWVFRDIHPEMDIIAPVKVGNNVFIGYGCTILPGTVIGNDVIIGAGSVVKGCIPDRVVIAGVPARVIRDLDDHYEKIKSQMVPTKFMNREEKRGYLTRGQDVN